MLIELTKGQEEANEEIQHWLKTLYKQVFEVEGPAGTGKTTLIRYAIEKSNIDPSRVLYVSLVGRMALVLRMKGLNGRTIHGVIYEPYEDVMLRDGNPIIVNGRPMYELRWRPREEILDVDLIVLDEAGVVGENIALDLLKYKIPILALGDLSQLDPPFGKSYFLKNPDVSLWEIMRQAEGDPILELATRARLGLPIANGSYGKKCHVIKRKDISDKMMTSMNAIICATNNTRNEINSYMREDIYGRYNELPELGDKMICRKNNWNEVIGNDIALTNGMVGYVQNPISLDSISPHKFNMDFRPDFMDDEYYCNIEIDLDYLTEPCSSSKRMNFYNKGNKFEYGYSITAYLAQGSEYDNVMVFDENIGNENFKKKYRYTAITRAKKFLIMVKI